MAQHPWIITSGILGNIVSIMVYLAPLPTFFRVYKKKSTEGFQSIPYMVALFSAMLWIYYATLKPSAFLLLIINSIGSFVESVYIIVFVVYAPKKARILTLKLFLVFNFGGFLLILVLTHFFARGTNRLHIVGWSCVALSAAVFAAPLSIMRLVIRTKSVEFMPFTLSFFLTLSAVTWLIYGLLLKDFYIALPNILGVIFGMIQMLLYVFYKKWNGVQDERKQPQRVLGTNASSLGPTKTSISSTETSCLQVFGENEVSREQNWPENQVDNCKESTNEVQLREFTV